jgi:hypothetical protein
MNFRDNPLASSGQIKQPQRSSNLMIKLNKQTLTALAAAALMAIGVVTVGAQEDDNPPTMPPIAEEGRGPHGERGEFRERLRNSEMHALVEEYTGLTGREIRQEIRSGATLGELIEANGQNTDSFVSEALSLTETRLDTAVENGRFTEAEAAEKLSEIEANIEARLDGTFERGQRGPRGAEGTAPDA